MRSRSAAERLDAADPLAGFRERFVIADPELLYLDGNSLGRLPVATRARLHAVIDQWGTELVGGWETGWLEAPRRAGDAIAPIVGAQPGQVIVTDSVTVNLYKLAAAAHRDGPLVTPAGSFPTDRYVLEGLAAERGVEARFTEEVEGAGLVVWSQVDYRTGELADVAGITARCREADIPLIWDLSHSAGAVPVELNRHGIELAVGCTYKYLNGGPGATGFLYATDPDVRSPIWGWFAQRDQFDMDRPFAPQAGVERFLAGTPSQLALAAVEEGARITAEAGIDALRAKSIALLELLIECLPPQVELASPRDSERRGSHVAVRHADARALNARLIAAKVIGDYRTPDLIRLAVTPLYTRFVDVWDAMDRLRSVVT